MLLDSGSVAVDTNCCCGAGTCGACCSETIDACDVFNEADCIAVGGVYLGDGVSCEPGHISPCEGGCNYVDPDLGPLCIQITSTGCAALPSGVFLGYGTSCCPTGPCGACCINDMSGQYCIYTNEVLCAATSGTYLGDGTVCAPPDLAGCMIPAPTCSAVGACCILGVCSIKEQVPCFALGGSYSGDGTICADTDCNFGACCELFAPCQDNIAEADCIGSGGTYQGAGTFCIDYSGACCFDGSCAQAVCESTCINDFGGTFQGIGTTCDPDPC